MILLNRGTGKHLSFVIGRRGFPPRLVPYSDFLSHAMTFSLLLFTEALLLVQVQCWAWEIMGVNNSSQKLPHSPREGKTQGSRCHQVPGLKLGHPQCARDAEGAADCWGKSELLHSLCMVFDMGGIGHQINRLCRLMPLRHWSASEVKDLGSCSASLYLP